MGAGQYGSNNRVSYMKVLVVGCGSIGKRHISNLLKLNDIKCIMIYTKNTDCIKNFKKENKIEEVNSLQSISANFAIIANETHKHLETAITLADKDIDLFIEKPLSHNLNNIETLASIAKKQDLKIFIAYNLRFLGALNYIKKQLSESIIGTPYFAKIEVGQYLPSWRTERDYSTSYSARKSKGGGVALDLSHEIDYMCYLFGMPISWKAVKAKVSDLKIDSDDIFEGLYSYENNFVCNVHMDYLQQIKKRDLRISGSKGTLICDFIKKYIKIIRDDGEVVIDDENLFDLNKTYMDELKHFIESVKNRNEPYISLEDGINVLRLLEDGSVKG